MAEIIPAILSDSFKELEDKLSILSGHTALAHIDVSDATLTPRANWPYAGGSGEWEAIQKEERGFPYWEEMNFEAHLMVKSPEAIYQDWIRAGAERIVVQYEAFDTDEECSSFLLKYAEHFEGQDHLKVEVGLAVGLDTPISKVLDHVLECDFIHLMSIRELGAQGNEFEEGVFEKIAELRSSYPETIISIDGGVNLENAERLIEAGADRLVVGSYIWKAEQPLDALEDLVLETE